MRKPLIIYVTGTAGSGKSTLAQTISEKLQVPRISADQIHRAISFTNGKRNNRERDFHEVFVPLLIYMSQKNVSLVVDQILLPGKSERDVIDKVGPYAKLVYIHTYADDAIDRQHKRNMADPLMNKMWTKEELENNTEYHKSIKHLTDRPADFEKPVLSVRTDDGYEPDISEVMNFIKNEYDIEKEEE